MLGALIEKQLTTPDIYPLTLKALTAACNQTSNRDPVMAIEPLDVETTVLVLKTKGLARVVHPGSGERSTRYRQVADELLGLDEAERALVCVLLLRGAQTVAELRSRTERLHTFTSAEALEATLRGLAARPEPLAALLERRPGQKEPRWVGLLEDDPYIPRDRQPRRRRPSPGPPGRAGSPRRGPRSPSRPPPRRPRRLTPASDAAQADAVGLRRARRRMEPTSATTRPRWWRISSSVTRVTWIRSCHSWRSRRLS